VKEKFTGIIREIADLSAALVFESHRAPQQGEKTNLNNVCGSHWAAFLYIPPEPLRFIRAVDANKTSPNRETAFQAGGKGARRARAPLGDGDEPYFTSSQLAPLKRCSCI
jgi:hypothetical protein